MRPQTHGGGAAPDILFRNTDRTRTSSSSTGRLAGLLPGRAIRHLGRSSAPLGRTPVPLRRIPAPLRRIPAPLFQNGLSYALTDSKVEQDMVLARARQGRRRGSPGQAAPASKKWYPANRPGGSPSYYRSRRRGVILIRLLSYSKNPPDASGIWRIFLLYSCPIFLLVSCPILLLVR